MNEHIRKRMEVVASGYRQLYHHQAWAWILAGFGLAAPVLWWAGRIWPRAMPWAFVTWGVAGGTAIVLARRMVRRMARDPRWVARRIEAAVPALDSRLLTALDLETQRDGGKRSYLHHRLVEEVIVSTRGDAWGKAVPVSKLRAARRMHRLAGVFFAVVLLSLLASPGSFLRRAIGVDPRSGHAAHAVQVDPGDVELERGTGLLVWARFERVVPAEASLLWSSDSGATVELPMTRSLDDPVFAARIARVEEDGHYAVGFGDQRSDAYTVSVFDLPRLTRADARLEYPAYAGLEPKTVVDVRRVSALQGTELTWILHLNKPVARARLTDPEGAEVPLGPGSGDAVVQGRLELSESTRYRLYLTDEAGRENKAPPELVVRVRQNRKPDIRWEAPGRDVRVSALEEVTLSASVRDDLGLHRYGLSYSLAGQDPRDVELGQGQGRPERRAVVHALALEPLQLPPNQLVSFYFWAEDTGPDAAVRRSFSDLYFAEIRPFDEVFREGEPQPGGAQQPQPGEPGAGRSAQAEALVEQQKQIINGTWNVLRGAADDVAASSGLLRDAQQAARQQAEAMAETVEDADARIDLQAVLSHMGEAAERLGEAAEQAATAPLPAALSEEQSAYQALLRLQASEFDVTQNASNRGAASGARGSRSRMQRQLQQLQLSSDRNRYETQRQAQDQAAGREENRETFDRLRDLARRQADVNERLKELQSALAAAPEEEQEEIRRELKRLRDEQQRVLRDTDELAERMGERQNEEQMADARRQLEETRSNVRRASEALQDGQVSRAAAEGTRAEEQFRELREEFRQRASGRFADEMEQLRREARELADQQQGVSRDLARLRGQASPSLRGDGDRAQLEDQLSRQRTQLAEVLEEAQEVVEEAEEVEPLLAEALYDAVRDVELSRTDEALEATHRLLEAGFPEEAAQVEEVANRGIGSLRDGIETAAERVLGDGTEALRRAEQALDRLTTEAEAELLRAGQAPDAAGEAETTEEGRLLAGGPMEEPDTRPRARNGVGGGVQDARMPAAPFAGDDFRAWSDRLADVEQMIDVSDLQAQAARIREQARRLRSEARRASRAPNWDLVQLTVINPLSDLRDRVEQEIARRGSRDALVPIDDDPVPPVYAERVRQYYERLGDGK